MKSTVKNTMTVAGLLGLSGMLTLVQPVRAADSADGPAAGHQKGPRKGPLIKILGQLDLTDAQKDQIKPIMEAHGDKLKALHDDTTSSKEAKRDRMKEIMTDTIGKIRPILTADQAKKFDELLEQAKTKHHHDK